MTKKLFMVAILLLVNVHVFGQSNPDSIPFAPAVNYGAGDAPFSVFCADLDGDTYLDLAVANTYSGVSILKNNRDGTFQTAVNYGAGDWSVSVFCADLDGDGDLDLAVANSGPDYLSILKNNGNGTFQTAVNYGAGNGSYSVFCADLDGDTALDLAVANTYSDNVSIFKNNGDGTFQTAVNYGAGNNPFSVFCADLDGDTALDLAVASYGSNNVSILKNNGDGTFQSAVTYGAGNYPLSVFCADLDGDTALDLAVANYHSHNVSILKNNGDGTFQTAVNYGAGDYPRSVFCADLDGEGDLDLAVANSNSDNVSILKNNGDGTFQTAVNYGAGDYSMFVFCADLDGDTDLDLAVANNSSSNVSILKNLTIAFPGVDLAVNMYGNSRARPGFQKTYWSLYGNERSDSAENVVLNVRLHPEVDYVSCDPSNCSVKGQNISWNLDTVPGLSWGWASVTFYIPTSVPAGTILKGTAKITTTSRDQNMRNNRSDEEEEVVTSWDPNDKDAQPWGTGLAHYVAPDERLRYTIFFENDTSATAEAIYITVVDTLDPNLDWSTLQFGPMSHPDTCEASFDPVSGVIIWQCDSIMLPPNHNPPEGEGFVSFSIKPDSGLAFGTKIRNRAYIQFDFNPWVAAPDSGPVIRTLGAYGDVNASGGIDLVDVIYLANYILMSGPSPIPLESADVNCDGAYTLVDVILLARYVLLGEPFPC